MNKTFKDYFIEKYIMSLEIPSVTILLNEDYNNDSSSEKIVYCIQETHNFESNPDIISIHDNLYDAVLKNSILSILNPRDNFSIYKKYIEKSYNTDTTLQKDLNIDTLLLMKELPVNIQKYIEYKLKEKEQDDLEYKYELLEIIKKNISNILNEYKELSEPLIKNIADLDKLLSLNNISIEEYYINRKSIDKQLKKIYEDCYNNIKKISDENKNLEVNYEEIFRNFKLSIIEQLFSNK